MLARQSQSGAWRRHNPRWGVMLALLVALLVLAAAYLPSAVAAEGASAEGKIHFDIGVVLLKLIIMLAAAKIGGAVLERLGQPAVLGELLAGVVVGASVLNLVQVDAVLEIFSEIGVILLLFEVGLESSLDDLMKVGIRSFLVAIVGVVCPMALGVAVASWLGIGGGNVMVPLFLGATLAATSVGITARVLSDLGRLQMNESKIILGAAVIDDVLGLVILSIIVGLLKSGTFELFSIVKTASIAFAFLVVALVAGNYLAQPFISVAQKLKVRGMMIVTAVIFAFFLSFVAYRIGLATIVGAFAAGLLLERVDLEGFQERIHLDQLIRPVADVLVPLFFVHMGMLVELRSFLRPEVIGIALLLTALAIAGKLVCGVVQSGSRMSKLIVGVGMIPRGEVGLIFASFGLANNVIDKPLYSAILVMVMLTTFVTPPALKMLLARQDSTIDQPASPLAESRASSGS